MSALRFLLAPGDLAAALAGLEAGSDSRQILRMFVNTLVWGAIGTIGVALFVV